MFYNFFYIPSVMAQRKIRGDFVATSVVQYYSYVKYYDFYPPNKKFH